MSKIQKIIGNYTDAVNQLNTYKNLASIISFERLEKKVQNKYPLGPELPIGEVHDFYTALLHAKYMPHEGNAASPDSMLTSIDFWLPQLSLSISEKNKFGEKFLQLKSTSFWGTFSELGVAYAAKKNSTVEVVLEYKFEPSKGKNSKDADLAFLDTDGKPQVLLDVYTPKYKDNFLPSIENCSLFVSNKYASKFNDHCLNNPDDRIAIVISVLENEICILPYLLQVMSGQTGLLSQDLLACTNLLYAQLCTFRCRDSATKILEMVPLAKYEKQNQHIL